MKRARLSVLLLLLAGVAPAQDQPPLQLSVTSASGRSVYLDKGRADGLAQGTIVRLFPPGVAQIEVEVRVVSSHSARADLPPGLPLPPVGTRGEASVTPPPADDNPPPNGPLPKVDHPPWTRSLEQRDSQQPLLEPSIGQRPEARPVEVHGRLFAIGQWNQDHSGGANADYLLGRIGTSLQATNPFGQGGRLQFAGELDERRTHIVNGPDDADASGRLDLLSYAIGTEQFAALRLEGGRFFSNGLPELGLLDGVETIGQFDGGWRIGGGVGSYPLPFPDRDSGEDYGVHAFVDYAEPKSREYAWGLGVQKTWHQGAPDRDLLLARGEWRPFAGGWLYGTAKFDYYTASDTVKGSGLELSEFLGQARVDGTTAGTGLTLSRFTWPELKRAEFQNLPVELVRDGFVDRLGWSGWWRVLPSLRLSTRLDHWRDQAKAGTAEEVGLDWSDAFDTGTNVLLSVYESDGSFASGPGARARLRRQFGSAAGSIGYSFARYDIPSGPAGSNGTFTRQSVDLGVDWYFDSWDLSFTAERWFGDAEDAFTIGLFGQLRF